MEKPCLFNDASDSEPDCDFKINKSYAQSYKVWRNKEELQKLKDLSKELSDSSSESEEEDIPKIEKDFLKTLSLLKSKDPKIYNDKIEFFKETSVEKKPKVKKEKPIFMKDYERQLVIERSGKLDEDEEPVVTMPTRGEELQEIKNSFKTAFDSDDDDDGNEEFGGLFQVRKKTKEEEEKEEAEHLQWLKGQNAKIDKDTEKDMSFLRKFWNDPKLDDDEKFLRDFFLNEKYIEKDDSSKVPSYAEITEDLKNLSDDEKVLEQQELFEHKYNFRFEEPDQEYIKRFPRTIGDSLRRIDNKRKIKREEYAERKRKEKEQKREELKRLKALKRKEIEEKFLKLKEASGQNELNFEEEDMESDFDPEKHDRKMKELFNDNYYTVEEMQKPEFEYDEELDGEDWDHWTRTKTAIGNTVPDADSEVASDGDDEDDQIEDPKLQHEQEMIESTHTGRKKNKKKSLFAKVVSKPKPIFDPDGKSFDEYVDEYYKLDYEDVIGDLPVRFKYRKVVPNAFGLTINEILTAHDKELNRWCSVKKTCQYRKEEEEKYDVQAFDKKAQNVAAKQKILTSLYSQSNEDTGFVNTELNSTSTTDKLKKKRSKKKKKASTTSASPEEQKKLVSNHNNILILTKNAECAESNDVSKDSKKERKKKRKNKTINSVEESSEIDSGALNMDVENFLGEHSNEVNVPPSDIADIHGNEIIDNQILSNKSKKRKRKKHRSLVGNINQDSLNESGFTEAIEQNANIRKENINGEIKCSLQNVTEVNSLKNKRKLYVKDMSPDENAINSSANIEMRPVDAEDILNVSASASNKLKKHRNKNETFSAQKMETNTTNSKKDFKKTKKFRSSMGSFNNKSFQKQGFHGKQFSSNSKTHDEMSSETDKRLALSNERLSAFGINPKKFKSSIIFSNK